MKEEKTSSKTNKMKNQKYDKNGGKNDKRMSERNGSFQRHEVRAGSKNIKDG